MSLIACTKTFKMHGVGGPVARHVSDFVHQALGTATVNMASRYWLFQQLPQIKGLLDIPLVMVKPHFASPLIGFELIQKSRTVRIACQINQLESPHGFSMQLLDH